MRALTQQYEQRVREAGFSRVCGIDEVGRGAWAGPVVAAGVIFDEDVKIKGLNDSKKLTHNNRVELAEEIKEKALAYSIQQLENSVIDEVGVGEANAEIIRMVIKDLSPDFALIDRAWADQITVPHEFIIKGDGKVFSIGAASILAKVYRDSLMTKYENIYPGYGFADHKGYGTKKHRDAIARLNICMIHRTSFKPISQAQLFK